MENILTDTKQLEKDNNMLKTELDNRIEDLAKQTKAGGDNKVTVAQILGLQTTYTNIMLFNQTFYGVFLNLLAKSR